MKNPTRTLFIAFGASAITALVLVIGILISGVLPDSTFNKTALAAALPPAQTQVQPATDQIDFVAAYEQALIDAYQNTLPSVVNIKVTQKFDPSVFDLPSPHNFGVPPGADPNAEPNVPQEFFNQGGGSGFVWDTAGHIVTNYHVVANATDIEVIFADDTVVSAEIVGSDPDSDLAVIKVDLPAEALKPVTLADSDQLQVGQISIAIGNPFGQEFTMTSGIISGIGRIIRGGNSGFSIPEVIQTDAPINPGNSGGPLLNLHGEVLGINTQMLSRSGSSAGIGFAVPINIAKQVVPVLIQGRTYQYAWLGIQGATLTADAVAFRNLAADTRGALVLGVAENGPAADAGLQGPDGTLDPAAEAFRFGGDIITAVDGQPINDMDDLITYLVKETRPGDKVELDVIKADGLPAQLEVTLGLRPMADTSTSENQ